MSKVFQNFTHYGDLACYVRHVTMFFGNLGSQWLPFTGSYWLSFITTMNAMDVSRMFLLTVALAFRPSLCSQTLRFVEWLEERMVMVNHDAPGAAPSTGRQ